MMAQDRKKEDPCANAGGTSPSACASKFGCAKTLRAHRRFKMAPRRPSEEEVGRKWDRCFVDTTFKTVGGAVFGGLFSLLFFKRAAWPVTLGIGIGLGAGYSNCRHQFYWDGPHGPPFGRPHWGRPFWARLGKDGEKQPSKPVDSPPDVQPVESQEPKKEDKPSES